MVELLTQAVHLAVTHGQLIALRGGPYCTIRLGAEEEVEGRREKAKPAAAL